MRVLQTERLTLRWFAPDDARFIVELLNDPGWHRFIGDRGVRDEDGARQWIADRLTTSYHQNGFGLWAMERRADRVLVGMCGLVRRDSLPDVDVGYALLPRFRGSGYVREAAAACLHHAATTLGLPRVLAITYPDNLPSIRVLESIGMTVDRRALLAGDEHESLIFSWTLRPSAP